MPPHPTFRTFILILSSHTNFIHLTYKNGIIIPLSSKTLPQYLHIASRAEAAVNPMEETFSLKPVMRNKLTTFQFSASVSRQLRKI
jgi:hypothetical protein